MTNRFLRFARFILVGRAACPLAGEVIINEAGKRAVKACMPAQGFRRDNGRKDLEGIVKALSDQTVDLEEIVDART